MRGFTYRKYVTLRKKSARRAQKYHRSKKSKILHYKKKGGVTSASVLLNKVLSAKQANRKTYA